MPRFTNMKLIALRNFSPDGVRKLEAGEEFEISDKSANILIQTKRANIAPAKRKKEEQPGQYERRDLRAES